VDGSKPHSSHHEAAARIGSDARPIAVDGRQPTDSPKLPGNMIVYYGNEELVGQGFVIALRAMGIRVDPKGEAVQLPPNSKEN